MLYRAEPYHTGRNVVNGLQSLQYSDLVKGGLCAAVSLELDDHGGLIRDEGDEDDIGKA